jgi:hypothetical protein
MGFPENALFFLAFEAGNVFTLFAHKLLAPSGAYLLPR